MKVHSSWQLQQMPKLQMFNTISDKFNGFKKTAIEKFQTMNCQSFFETAKENKLLFGTAVASLVPGGFAVYSLLQGNNETNPNTYCNGNCNYTNYTYQNTTFQREQDSFENIQDSSPWASTVLGLAGSISVLAGLYFCFRPCAKVARQHPAPRDLQQELVDNQQKFVDNHQKMVKNIAACNLLGRTAEQREAARDKLLGLFPNEYYRLSFDQARGILRDKKFIAEHNQCALAGISENIASYVTWEFPIRINFKADLAACCFEGVTDRPHALSNSKLAILFMLADCEFRREEKERYLKSIVNIFGETPDDRERVKKTLLDSNLLTFTFTQKGFDCLTQAPPYFIEALRSDWWGRRKKAEVQQALGLGLFAGVKDDDKVNGRLAAMILDICLQRKEVFETNGLINNKGLINNIVTVYETTINFLDNTLQFRHPKEIRINVVEDFEKIEVQQALAATLFEGVENLDNGNITNGELVKPVNSISSEWGAVKHQLTEFDQAIRHSLQSGRSEVSNREESKESSSADKDLPVEPTASVADLSQLSLTDTQNS